MQSDDISVVITCAGRGRRLMPLTRYKPKCLVEISGKPIIDYTIENIIKSGYKKLIIVDGFLSDIVRKHILDKKYPIDIKFIRQYTIDGTANAIFLANEFVNEEFIVLAGDTIYGVKDLKKLGEKVNSLLYTDIDDNILKKKKREYGTLGFKDDGTLKCIAEKTTPISNSINCNGYYFTDEVFEFIAETEYDERFGEKIITNTINLMIKDGIEFTPIKIESLDEISNPEDIPVLEERLKHE